MYRDPFRALGVDGATRCLLVVVALLLSAIAGCSFDASPAGAATPDTGTPGLDASANDAPDGGATSDAASTSDAGSMNDGAPPSDGADGGLVAVQILALNDFHGNLEPPTGSGALVTVPIDDPVVRSVGADGGVTINVDAGTAQLPAGGASYLAAHVKKLRIAQPNTLVVSAGDVIGASPFISNLFRDEPAILVMNAMGLDLNGVGNHEFDRGLAELVRLSVPGCSLGACDGGESFAGAKFQFLAANVQND